MFTLKSIIGSNKAIVFSLVIVIFTCIAARAVFAKSPSAQQLAAADVPVQQAIMEQTKEAHLAYLAAETKLTQSLACVQDASQCSFTPGVQRAD